MDIQELVEENRELRETLHQMREILNEALSTQELDIDDDDAEDEELED